MNVAKETQYVTLDDSQSVNREPAVGVGASLLEVEGRGKGGGCRGGTAAGLPITCCRDVWQDGLTELEHNVLGDSLALEWLVFGNVNEQSLQEIWRSKATRDFRRVFQRRIELEHPDPQFLPGPCRHCHKLYDRLAG